MKRLTTLALTILISTLGFGQCLVAYYPFNGNALDSTGNGFNGTVNGAVLTTDKDANANSAYLFDGTDDVIYCDSIFDVSTKTAITLAAWFNVNDIVFQSSYYTGVGFGRGPIGRLQIRARADTDRKFQAILANTGETDGSWVTATSDFNYGAWYHVTGVFKDKDVKLYVDGVDQGATVQATNGVDLVELAGIDSFRIGMANMAGNNAPLHFDGKLDEVRIYDCELTPQEIIDLYTSTKDIFKKSSVFKIYPNPTTGIATITNTEQGIKNIEVLDLFGRPVPFKFDIGRSLPTGQAGLLDIQDSPAGVYFVKVGAAVRKLVVQ